jgi:microcin C transport system substrate-binding protein
VIPHWHLRSDRVAYWNHLQRPAETPKNGIDLDNWWAKP